MTHEDWRRLDAVVPQGVEDELELPAGGRDHADIAPTMVPDAVPDASHQGVFGQDMH